MKILVTGAAGFIGYHVSTRLLQLGHDVIGLDNLNDYYDPALKKARLAELVSAAFTDVRADIADQAAMTRVFSEERPDAVLNLAAETHVDRSLDGPRAFVDTNIVGTFVLLETARQFITALPPAERERFRFLHVSTDEVYGTLASTGQFSEETPYAPNSPYAASKASADHLARAYFHSYGVPVLITNCSNNYGPYQFPEKLIPLMITNAIDGKDLPVYGDGLNVRDWLYVEDCCRAIDAVLHSGRSGEVYNIGSRAEKTNLEIVTTLLDLLNRPHSLIKFVTDRLGHDRRYATDPDKIETELGWHPQETFESGIQKTVRWYQDNAIWIARARSGEYLQYYERMYGET